MLRLISYKRYFALESMLHATNLLHDNANELIAQLMDNNYLNELIENKKINSRQYAIYTKLAANQNLCHKQILATQAWYNMLYKNLSERTKLRDLNKLAESYLIYIQADGKIVLLSPKPKIKLTDNPLTSVSITLPASLSEYLKKLSSQ